MAKEKIERKRKRRDERRRQRLSHNNKQRKRAKKSHRSGALSSDTEIRQTPISDLPVLTQSDQLMITEAINALGADHVAEVITIIKQGMNLPANSASDEIELDINTMDRRTQYRLFKFVQRIKNPRKRSKPGTHPPPDALLQIPDPAVTMEVTRILIHQVVINSARRIPLSLSLSFRISKFFFCFSIISSTRQHSHNHPGEEGLRARMYIRNTLLCNIPYFSSIHPSSSLGVGRVPVP